MKKLFSIAIPTWEINGKGAEYLEFSFNRIANQTINPINLEVVISDHSRNNDIEDLCKNWNSILDIKYVRCEEGRGKIAPNLNNAIRNCEGVYIKMLFQDDFLYDQHAMMYLYNRISKLNEVKWLVSSCVHTKDGETLYDPMIPYYHPYIYRGINTISCPSVLTIKNDEDKLYFDESLNWLVDVEYYKRLYDKFGRPEVLQDICIVNRDAEVRTTNMITENQKQEEIIRVSKMYD